MGIRPVTVLLVGGRCEKFNATAAKVEPARMPLPSGEVLPGCLQSSVPRTVLPFDLVRSQYQLPDRTAFSLLGWLVGARATLFFSARFFFGNGSLWLRMLERYKRGIGAPVLQSNALIEALAKLLDAEVRSYKEGTVDSRVDSTSSSTRSALYASST
jgi:hypothetical protein